MKRYLIPGTSLWAAPIVFGSGSFTADNEKTAFRQLDFFVEMGGNLIDTANIYGQSPSCDQNLSEQIIGRWLRERNQPADIFITTKGGHPRLESMNIPRLDEDSLAKDLESSRKALGKDCLDLYFLHRDDPTQPVEAMLSQLETFRQAGLIKFYGLSNWKADRLQSAVEWCQKTGSSGLAAVQNRWSLAQYNTHGSSDLTTAAVNEQIWQILNKNNLTVLAYGAMAKGFFSKISASDTGSLPDKLRRYYLNDVSMKRAEILRSISTARNIPPAQIALAWLLLQPFPVFPIVSFSSHTQIEEAMGAPAVFLNDDEMALLSAGSLT